MDLYNLEYHINAIVKDLNLAKMRRNREPDDAWQRIEHALDTAIELARQLGTQVSEIWNVT